jgi:hypothetical protein
VTLAEINIEGWPDLLRSRFVLQSEGGVLLASTHLQQDGKTLQFTAERSGVATTVTVDGHKVCSLDAVALASGETITFTMECTIA